MTIAVIGFPINIRDLLAEHKDLFAAKVKEIHFMNGPYNFGCALGILFGGILGDTTDCYGAAHQVLLDMPPSVKQFFQPNGADMCSGAPFWDNSCGDDANPMKRAHNDWMANWSFLSSIDACWPGRSSWDPLTVY